MKRIILLLILATSITFTFAQKNANVRKAKDKALMDKPDFAAAREAIKLALQDSTAKSQAETWYVAGLIGSKQSDAELTKTYLKQPFDTISKGKAMIESYDYFTQALKLDNVPDAKGKAHPRFSNDIKTILKEYYTIQPNLIGYGAYQFGKENFAGAVKTFEAFLEIPTLPVMKNEIKMDSTYDMITYYTAVCASGAKMHDKAIKYFEGMKDKKYMILGVYQSLANEYLSIKDTANYIKTIEEAIEKLPKESWFLQNLINFDIKRNKIQDALVYLNTAIEREPLFAQYQFVKGQLYLTLENFDEANKALNKAVQLDPTKPEAYAELGRSYYNKAVKMAIDAAKIKDTSLYNKEKKNIDEVFKQSIPYYKKAVELNPKEIEYKIPLKKLYYQLQMDSDYEAVSKEIKALQ